MLSYPSSSSWRIPVPLQRQRIRPSPNKSNVSSDLARCRCLWRLLSLSLEDDIEGSVGLFRVDVEGLGGGASDLILRTESSCWELCHLALAAGRIEDVGILWFWVNKAGVGVRQRS